MRFFLKFGNIQINAILFLKLSKIEWVLGNLNFLHLFSFEKHKNTSFTADLNSLEKSVSEVSYPDD